MASALLALSACGGGESGSTDPGPTPSFTIGGTISGFSGTVVLQNNASNDLTISANGAFTFTTALTDTSPYAVTVLTQPAGQTCTVANSAGTIAGANVTNVTVTCAANTFTVGGTVSGLLGSVVLRNNGGNDLTVSANGSFTFSAPVAQGGPYAVTVFAQPASQTCSVTNGTGTVGGANVANVSVTCTVNTFTVGGTVSGLSGSMVLRNNGGNDLAVSASGSFTFSAPVAQGGPFAVTVFTQPAGQTCTVANGAGTVAGANVTNVSVTCAVSTFTVGGTVSGLNGTVVLQNNGGNNLTRSANGTFTFSAPVAQGGPYAVTVLTQPTGQICSVTNGTGTVGGANITNVTLTCANAFTVGGTVSGLVGTVVLQNNGGNNLTVSANGIFTFSAPVAQGSTYAVAVLTQPAGRTCTVAKGAGTMAGANVTNVTVSCSTVSVTPKLGGLTTSQSQVFNATVANDVGSAGVTWTTTGGTLTSQTATSVTFSSALAGSFTITATSVAVPAQSASATIGVTDLAGVFTQRYDAQRTGQNRQEFALTSDTVTGSTFGKLFRCAVDAEVYAQPLYVANFAIAGGTHNVVLVATQNDSVYAFDADASPCVLYWQKSFLGAGVTIVPPADTGETGDINTIIGITGTPVIDSATGTLYVVAKTKETTGCAVPPCYFQRLHALDVATGNEKFGGPADISSALTVPGSGDTGDVTCPGTAGSVPFCPLRENQRPGLLLQNGKVYVAWGSHGDQLPYHGWVIGYDAANLALPPAVLFNTTPNGSMGGIWMSGTGPAADANGNIYVITGNGTFDETAPRTNYGDSFIKLSTATGLSVADFFAPFNQADLSARDFDVGSGGAIVLPDSAGSAAHPHLLIGGDKQGILYLIDRDNMSGFHAGGDQVVQEVTVTAGSCVFCGIFSTPAFWEGNLYVVAVGSVLKQYTIANASLTPALQAGDVFGLPGATPAVSSTDATNGIVWALDTSNNGTHNSASRPAILFAYDATSLNKLFSSPASGAGAAGNAVKFTVPTVANGKVYVGTQNELSVFGLLPN